MKSTGGKNYDKIMKVLQAVSIVFMAVMLVAMLILVKKFNISLENAYELSSYIKGGTFTVALVIIAFTAIKSFTLVFPLAVIFAVSGILFEDIFWAIAVNFVAIALSFVVQYYFGKFAGKDLVDTLKARFPKIKKIDDFAGKNEFMLVYVIKASGIGPSDLLSVVFGAMNVNFWKYFIASNLAMLPFNVFFTLVAHKGDITNPKNLVYLVPIAAFSVIMSIVVKRMTGNKQTRQ